MSMSLGRSHGDSRDGILETTRTLPQQLCHPRSRNVSRPWVLTSLSVVPLLYRFMLSSCEVSV